MQDLRWVVLWVGIAGCAGDPGDPGDPDPGAMAGPDVRWTADVGGPDLPSPVDIPAPLDRPALPETVSPPFCKPPPVTVRESGADETFRRGPYLQSVLEGSAVVVWMDAEGGGEGCVDYTVGDGEPATRCAAPDEAGQYEVALDELPADTSVSYSARVGERSAGPFVFRSAPALDRAVKLLVFADSHANTTVLRTISEAALAKGVHLAVGVGDLISQPEERQWDAFFEGLRPLGHRVGFWPVQGNHENKHASYFHDFVVPGAALPPRPAEAYYAARVGQVWFASLELEDWLMYAVFAGGEFPETTWLREAIESEEARSARWRVLFIHQPPWAMGWGHCDGYDGEPALRAALVPFAAEHGVAAMFFGHMHGYERGQVDGVTLITTGGAGGALDHECEHEGDWPDPWLGIYAYHYTIVDAGCDEMTITARGLDGTVLDQFAISGPDTSPPPEQRSAGGDPRLPIWPRRGHERPSRGRGVSPAPLTPDLRGRRRPTLPAPCPPRELTAHGHAHGPRRQAGGSEPPTDPR